MANTLNLGDGNWATKEGSLLGYNSENNNYKPLPFDFSRGSTPIGSKATTINKDGLIETVGNNVPRIDYKDDSKGALLLEPSRSNAITYSEDFSQSSWAKTSVSITSNSILSPDGSLSASTITEDSSLNNHRISVNGLVGSGTHTISVFAKANDRNWLIIRNASNNAWFDISNGIVGTVQSGTGSIEAYENGWYRCSVTMSSLSTPAVGIADNNGSYSYQGNGTGSLYIWGAVAEQGSYPTSYIPTQGSVVTRLADECEQTPPSGIIGQTELTIFYQGLVERLGGSDGHAITLSQSADGAGSSRVLLYRNSSNGNMYVYVQDTTTQFSTPLLANSNPQINDKYAIAIKNNDLVVYCNGVKVSENNSGTLPSTQYLILNKWNNQINEQNKINQVKLYNTRLSNSELQALTSN